MTQTEQKTKMTPDQRLRLYGHLIDRGVEVVKVIFRIALGFYIVYAFLLCVKAIVGTQTDVNLNLFADVAVTLFSMIGNWELVAYGLCIAFALWALAERRLRKSKIVYFQKRIKELELELDPKRTSSGLAETGDTAKEDL